MRAVDAAVAMGLLDVTGGAIGEPPATTPDKPSLKSAFNRAILDSDASAAGRSPWRAPSAARATPIGDFDAAILHELVRSGRDGIAARVDTRLAGSRRSLQRDGKAITDAAERAKLVEQACEAFFATSLPQLTRLGIFA